MTKDQLEMKVNIAFKKASLEPKLKSGSILEGLKTITTEMCGEPSKDNIADYLFTMSLVKVGAAIRLAFNEYFMELHGDSLNVMVARRDMMYEYRKPFSSTVKDLLEAAESAVYWKDTVALTKFAHLEGAAIEKVLQWCVKVAKDILSKSDGIRVKMVGRCIDGVEVAMTQITDDEMIYYIKELYEKYIQ
jgi:hypothetical protein